MWRSLFLAIGITMCIIGVECMFIEEAVLAKSVAEHAPAAAVDSSLSTGAVNREIKTKEWMPWSFLGVGAVIILYTITIPRRLQPQ